MKVELILPIARLRGKINSKSPFYFKTVNGKTFVIVARMKAEGSKKSRKQLWKIATKAYDAENQ